MLSWTDVKQLHVEISSLCNSVCPGCPRYPTSGFEPLPHINNNWVWSLEDVRKNLPLEDISHITYFLINGSHGDFLTNPAAIEIIQHFLLANPNAKIDINTNAGARNYEFWKKLGKLLSNVEAKLFIALDGLEDTHSIYRRNTQWNTVLNNAKTFIDAGGKAIWTMTKFDFNSHQVNECAKMSKELGFSGFRIRDNNRPSLVIRDANKLTKVDTSLIDNAFIKRTDTVTDNELLKELIEKQRQIDNGTFYVIPNRKKIPINDDSLCESITNKSIFISGEWVVSPCCHIGGVISSRHVSALYQDFLDGIHEQNLSTHNYIASAGNTVKTIVSNHLKWMYDKLPSTNVITTCSEICGGNIRRLKLTTDTVIISD